MAQCYGANEVPARFEDLAMRQSRPEKTVFILYALGPVRALSKLSGRVGWMFRDLVITAQRDISKHCSLERMRSWSSYGISDIIFQLLQITRQIPQLLQDPKRS